MCLISKVPCPSLLSSLLSNLLLTSSSILHFKMASSQQIVMKRPSAAIIAKPTAANLALLNSAQPSLPSASMGSDHSSQASQHLGQQDSHSSQGLQQQPLAVQQPPVPRPAVIKAEQGDANAQASVGNAEGASKVVGRPQIGVSRAAQKAWANYRRSPKGQKQLNSLPADQVEDFRLTWLVDKEKAMNEVKQSAKTTITEADSALRRAGLENRPSSMWRRLLNSWLV